MKVTFKEVSRMLQHFQRAAMSTQEKCKANQEPGYESRRAGDVDHAQGRLDAIRFVQTKLAELQEDRVAGEDIESQVFLDSFAAELEAARATLASHKCSDYFTYFGKLEAYSDIHGSIKAWESLPAPM